MECSPKYTSTSFLTIQHLLLPDRHLPIAELLWVWAQHRLCPNPPFWSLWLCIGRTILLSPVQQLFGRSSQQQNQRRLSVWISGGLWSEDVEQRPLHTPLYPRRQWLAQRAWELSPVPPVVSTGQFCFPLCETSGSESVASLAIAAPWGDSPCNRSCSIWQVHPAPLLLFISKLAAVQLTPSEMYDTAPWRPTCLAYLGILLQGIVDQ